MTNDESELKALIMSEWRFVAPAHIPLEIISVERIEMMSERSFTKIPMVRGAVKSGWIHKYFTYPDNWQSDRRMVCRIVKDILKEVMNSASFYSSKDYVRRHERLRLTNLPR